MGRDDIIVVGAGPNGLAAAITAAQAGRRVHLIEGHSQPGGGCRSAELTLPGFVHDVCSAIHPLAVASPFFRTLPLSNHGVDWIHSPAPAAHPLDDGSAITLERELGAMADQLGADAGAWSTLLGPFVEHNQELTEDLLAPMLHWPRHPFTFGRFAPLAALPSTSVARALFHGERARALFVGMAAHSILPLEAPGSTAFGLTLAASGHALGWPFPRGGAQRITDALVAIARMHGVEFETGRWINSHSELPPAAATLLDVTPKQLLAMFGERLNATQRARLARFRYGPGVFKVDYALSEPIPWRAEACRRAATVHIGGSLAEIAASERAPWRGQHAERPFVLLAQHTLYDSSRAPPGKHTAWAYCHVPPGSERDMSDAIDAQIERFAPGFRDCVLARHTHNTAQMQAYNPNYIGGDIIGGAQTLRQVVFRPVFGMRPFRSGLPGVYLCSSSTPPGGGVHGMCGHLAAREALRILGAT